MTATADDISARIDSLQKSRDAGVLTVRHGMDLTTFKSSAEMDVTLAKLKAQLVALQGGTPRPRVNYIEQRTKGIGDMSFDPFKDWT